MHECTHKTIDDFSIETPARRFWTCSNCGAKEPWNYNWSYYGNYECKNCSRVDILWVACCDQCRDILQLKMNRGKVR